MNIEWAIPCRYAETCENRLTMVGAGIDRIQVDEIPTSLPVAFGVKLRLLPEEIDGSPHRIEIVIRGPEGTVIEETAFDWSADGSQSVEREDWLETAVTEILVTFDVADEGQHTFEFTAGATSVFAELLIST